MLAEAARIAPTLRTFHAAPIGTVPQITPRPLNRADELFSQAVRLISAQRHRRLSGPDDRDRIAHSQRFRALRHDCAADLATHRFARPRDVKPDDRLNPTST